MRSRLQKVVLDTNVVVSSFWGGKPGRVLQLWQEGHFKVLVSLEILQEYQDVLQRFRAADEDLEGFLASFTAAGRSLLILPQRRHHVIAKDPADDKFLDCAVAGRADCLVSGDAHLLALRVFEGIPILKPAAFLDKIEA